MEEVLVPGLGGLPGTLPDKEGGERVFCVDEGMCVCWYIITQSCLTLCSPMACSSHPAFFPGESLRAEDGGMGEDPGQVYLVRLEHGVCVGTWGQSVLGGKLETWADCLTLNNVC